MPNIHISKEFAESLQLYCRTYPSLARKISRLRDDLKEQSISFHMFKLYDIANLGDGYFRVKFPPYRAIIHMSEDTIIFEQLFKRK
jgi:hypothetical protein